MEQEVAMRGQPGRTAPVDDASLAILAKSGARIVHDQLEELLRLKREVPPRSSGAAPRAMSNDKLSAILKNAKMASRNLQFHRDCLLFLELRLPEVAPRDKDLSAAIELAAENDAGLTREPAFDAHVDAYNLFDALIAHAHQFRSRPTTLTEAIPIAIESAFYAVKLAQELYLLFAAEFLDHPAASSTSSASSSSSGEAPDPDDGDNTMGTRAKFDRALALVNLAVTHVDLAIAIISCFLSPREVAAIDHVAYQDAILI